MYKKKGRLHQKINIQATVMGCIVTVTRDVASGGARGASAPPTHPEHVEFS